jgi:MFS family permease
MKAHSSPNEPGRAREQRLIVLIAVLLFESALYSAVTPLLPHYAHLLGASKVAVGVLAAAYSAGLIPGSLLGGWVATRIGMRRATVVGLVAFAPAVAAFGFARDLVALDALRFAQGVACGFIWGGALTWLIAASPREHRGRVLGSVSGAAAFGTLLGPLVGTLAVAAGTELVFSVVGAVGLMLAVWVMLHPEPRAEQPPAAAGAVAISRRRLWASLVHAGPGMALGAWLIMLEAGSFGVITALVPLRLSRFGASGVAIGATFLLASALSMLLAPTIGRLTDRHGARLPIATGLILSALILGLLPLPHTWAALAVLTAVGAGGPIATYMTPAASMMTEAVERAGITLLLATTLFNLAYATGETIGAPAAAALSQVTNDAVPLLLLGVIMLATLLPVLRYRPRPPQPATEAQPRPESAREASGRVTARV